MIDFATRQLIVIDVLYGVVREVDPMRHLPNSKLRLTAWRAEAFAISRLPLQSRCNMS